LSPIYEYRCGQNHRLEVIRKYDARDELTVCDECGHPMYRIPSAHHRQPDGLYSYAPNVGSPDAFEQRAEAIRRRREGA
jgi:putative FmdB family regulatory protein